MMFSNFRMKKIIVVILTAPKVALKTEAFVMSQTFVHVRWGILDIRVPTVSDFQDVCMELALKALNAIAIQDGKESTAIFVSSTNKIFNKISQFISFNYLFFIKISLDYKFIQIFTRNFQGHSSRLR